MQDNVVIQHYLRVMPKLLESELYDSYPNSKFEFNSRIINYHGNKLEFQVILTIHNDEAIILKISYICMEKKINTNSKNKSECEFLVYSEVLYSNDNTKQSITDNIVNNDKTKSAIVNNNRKQSIIKKNINEPKRITVNNNNNTKQSITENIDEPKRITINNNNNTNQSITENIENNNKPKSTIVNNNNSIQKFNIDSHFTCDVNSKQFDANPTELGVNTLRENIISFLGQKLVLTLQMNSKYREIFNTICGFLISHNVQILEYYTFNDQYNIKYVRVFTENLKITRQVIIGYDLVFVISDFDFLPQYLYLQKNENKLQLIGTTNDLTSVQINKNTIHIYCNPHNNRFFVYKTFKENIKYVNYNFKNVEIIGLGFNLQGQNNIIREINEFL